MTITVIITITKVVKVVAPTLILSILGGIGKLVLPVIKFTPYGLIGKAEQVKDTERREV